MRRPATPCSATWTRPAIAGAAAGAGPADARRCTARPRTGTTFLLRPDLGRRLASRAGSAPERRDGSSRRRRPQRGLPTCVLVIADGLSAPAIERNALPMLAAIRASAPADWRIGPGGDRHAGAGSARRRDRRVAGRRAGGNADRRAPRPQLARQPGHLPHLAAAASDAATPNETASPTSAPRGLATKPRRSGSGGCAGEARRLRLTGVQLKDRSGSGSRLLARRRPRRRRDRA